MSRLPATSAANLANDLEHALTVCEQQLADTVQQLEEANALIDGVRIARGIIRQQVDTLTRSAWSDRSSVRIRLDDYRTVLDLLDEVPGL